LDWNCVLLPHNTFANIASAIKPLIQEDT